MKTKINSLLISQLRVGELVPFLKNTLVPLQLYPIAINPKLKTYISKLAQTLNDMENVSKRGTYLQETKAVRAADYNRDNRASSFVLYLEAAMLCGIEAEEMAAELLLQAIKTKGDIPRLSLKEETAAICDLNMLFTTNPRYVEALATANAKSRWEAVWAAEQEFEATYGYRNGLMVEEKVEASQYELSKRARRELADVLELLEDCYHVEEKPEYLEMINRINQEIDTLMPSIRARLTAATRHKAAGSDTN